MGSQPPGKKQQALSLRNRIAARREGSHLALLFVLMLWWKAEEYEDLVILQRPVPRLGKAALERFLLRARQAVRLKGTVNVLVTSSAELRAMNRQFLGKKEPTDVLSFPPSEAALRPARPFAGDVAISADIARENADRLGHSLADEIKILALHGVLHLAGFDHERDNGMMARKELQLRRQLKLPAALLERAEQTAAEMANRRKAGGQYPGAGRWRMR
jgi:probable rRNA maturation factor